MPNNINASSATATPSFSLGIAPTYLGVVSLVNPAGEVLRRWRLQQPKCTIGSDRQANIWIDDAKIASFHALLVFGSTNAIIKSFGPGLRLNGQAVQESAVRVGDRLELAGHTFVIESLTTSPLTARPGSAIPDATPALDPAQVGRPTNNLNPDTLHLSKLEGRVDELLQRLGDIDDKITRTSTEQKNDFSRQCDSLRSDTEHLRRIITQDFSSQLRTLTDDIERQSKARETRFDEKLDTLNSEFHDLRSGVENGIEQIQQQAEERLQNIEQAQRSVDSRIAQVESLQQQTQDQFAQLEAYHQQAEERYGLLRQDNLQLAASIQNATSANAPSANFDELQNKVVELVQSMQNDFQDLRGGLETRFDELQQDTANRLTLIENQANSFQQNQPTDTPRDPQPEIEALQARLSQLEGVLADLAATVHERATQSPAATDSEYRTYRNEVPRHDSYNDFLPQTEDFTPPQNAITHRFNSDTTTPFSRPVEASNYHQADEPVVDELAENEEYNRYASYTEHSQAKPNSQEVPTDKLPAWFVQSTAGHAEVGSEEQVEDTAEPTAYSPLLRSAVSAEDNEDGEAPVAHWSTASSVSAHTADHSHNVDPILEDASHSPLLRSLLREEAREELEETASASHEDPMFNQRDWDESDSYLKSEHPTNVTALDILRASYGDANKETFSDEQEDKWVNKLQQFSDAIEEEPDQTLSAVGRALTSEQAEQADETEPEEDEVVVPTPPPAAPSRLGGVSAGRGLGAAQTAAAPAAAEAHAPDDDSVESYMQKLLARMRGDEPEPAKPSAANSSSSSSSSSSSKNATPKPSNSKAVRNTYSPLRKSRLDPAAALIASRPKVDDGEAPLLNADGSENLDAQPADGPGVTVPRGVPEKASDLAALRELANDSARAAVKTSDKKVKPISNAVKLTIAGLGAAFGVILLVSNGLRVNLTLVAAATSFMLSAIWVLDVIQSIVGSKKRDQNNGGSTNKVQMKIAGRK
jgi:pSer/pThr/pTyr-binding forkhead associated (FHA) protein